MRPQAGPLAGGPLGSGGRGRRTGGPWTEGGAGRGAFSAQRGDGCWDGPGRAWGRGDLFIAAHPVEVGSTGEQDGGRPPPAAPQLHARPQPLLWWLKRSPTQRRPEVGRVRTAKPPGPPALVWKPGPPPGARRCFSPRRRGVGGTALQVRPQVNCSAHQLSSGRDEGSGTRTPRPCLAPPPASGPLHLLSAPPHGRVPHLTASAALPSHLKRSPPTSVTSFPSPRFSPPHTGTAWTDLRVHACVCAQVRVCSWGFTARPPPLGDHGEEASTVPWSLPACPHGAPRA